MKQHSKAIKILAFILAVGFIVTTMAACGKKKAAYDNENDALVFSTLELDRVFNPFFSTSATDSNVVGMTQIGMLGNDKDGGVTYGDDEAVVVKDMQTITKGTKDVDQTTTYYFVLKNNVRFSNDTPLTMKDVLFNLYVYLDPVYTGSATIYSTDIVGLKEYRTQSANERDQEEFMRKYEIAAQQRIDDLTTAKEEIYDEHEYDNWPDNDAEYIQKFKDYLAEYSETNGLPHLTEDFDKACELFRKELETDWSNSLNSYEDIIFTDANGAQHKNLFTTDAESFLYNEGYIIWHKSPAPGELEYNAGSKEAVKAMTKDAAINFVYNDKIPESLDEVINYWVTATDLKSYIANAIMEAENATLERTYKNISGIKFANRTEPVSVNGKTYAVPEYEADGTVKDGFNEVLSITINNVDPKAIWNFAFTVAPMYYYSDKAHIDAFDYEENFGVEYRSQTFMNSVINSDAKIGVPVGAGPYAASRSAGGITGVTKDEFYAYGTVYYERNPYYIMGPAKVKKLRFRVVSSSTMLSSLYTGEIDFAEPNAKTETVNELKGKAKDGISYQNVRTAGYGYIGINAGKVPTLAVRQAIMHAIDTKECVDYYMGTASPIHRSMSLSSWAYPHDENGQPSATAYYPFVGGPVPDDLTVVNPAYRDYVTQKGYTAGQTMTEADQKAFIKKLVEDAGYTLNGNGVYHKSLGSADHVLKYTFTVVGDEQDHPAWNALSGAGDLLNSCGFEIITKTDPNGLTKLATGSLTVWAAAWSTTIDPDMYQVYHQDSTASSVLNWGYRQIKQNAGGRYDTEVAILSELSELIDAAREVGGVQIRDAATGELRDMNEEDVRNERSRIYSAALDLVMQLAVELPTYQRDDLFAYNSRKLDEKSLNQNPTPFKGLTTDIHLLSLVTAK